MAIEPAINVAGSKPAASRGACDFIVDELFPLVPGLQAEFECSANLLLADCGDGIALHRTALRFPHSRFVGIDELPWNVTAATRHARRARVGNLWFHADAPEKTEVPPVYHVVVSLDPEGFHHCDPHKIVSIAGAVRPDGVLFFENDNGTARASLLAMGFRKVCEMRPAGAPSRRFIVAVR